MARRVFKQVARKSGIITRACSNLNRESAERKRSNLAFLLMFACDETRKAIAAGCRGWRQNVVARPTNAPACIGKTAPLRPGPQGAGAAA